MPNLLDYFLKICIKKLSVVTANTDSIQEQRKETEEEKMTNKISVLFPMVVQEAI